MAANNTTSENKSSERLSSQRRAPAVRLAQRKQISRMLTFGHSQSEIADALDISEATVSREVAKMKDGFRAQTTASVRDLQTAELEKLSEVESAAWLAHNKTGSNDSLGIILRVVKARSIILGLDSPDMRIVMQRFEEGKQLLFQAVTEVLGDDPDILQKLSDKISELDSQRSDCVRVRTIEPEITTEEKDSVSADSAKLSFVKKSEDTERVRAPVKAQVTKLSFAKETNPVEPPQKPAMPKSSRIKRLTTDKV